MSLKKTFFIFLIFALFAGGYYLDQQHIEKKTASDDAASRLVKSAKDKISDLTIKIGGQTTTLKKQGADWSVTAPVASRADRPAVDQIIDQLDQAKRKDAFDVEEAKLGDYGLKTPAIEVTAEATAESYKEHFALGADTTDNTETYARIGDEKKVFTVPNTLKTQLNKTPTDLRDKRAVPASLTEATTVTLASTTATVEVAKAGEQWRLMKPVEGKADAAKITDILNELNNAKRSDFVDSTSLNLASYGLDHPQWSASLYVAGENPATSKSLRTLEIGSALPGDATKYYARLVGDPGIFALNKEVLAKGSPTVDDLRAKEIFSIPIADLGQATFKVLNKPPFTVVRDSAGQWRFADDRETRLDQAFVNSKLSALVGLKAKKFITGTPPDDKSGLSSPKLNISVSNKAGTTTESLITGSKDIDDFVYAEIPSTKQVFGIDWTVPGGYFITREDCLDKTLFNFSEDAVQKIDMTEGSHTLALVKTASGGWTSQGGKEVLQVEGPKMTALIYGLTSLKWDRKLNPNSSSDSVLIKTQKLEHPPRFIVVLDSTGKELARLGLGGEEFKYAYVTTDKNAYFAVNKLNLASVSDPVNAILAKAAGKTPEPGTANGAVTPSP